MFFSFFVFFIVLSLLVFFHEFGHFLAAKKSGMLVEEFGFGYPPRIFGKKIGDTIYSFNLIPFGGFVKIFGQESWEKKNFNSQQIKKAFFSQPKKNRILVLLAGVTGNFILGFLCFWIIYSKIGIPQKLGYVEVVEVVADSPAEKIGIKKGEKILAINGEKTTQTEEFIKIVEENKGKEIEIETAEKKLKIVPRENPPQGEGRLGVMINDTKMVFYPWWQMPARSAWEGLKESIFWAKMILKGIIISLSQIFKGIAPEVAGPIGIFQMTSMAAKEGILSLIQFIGVLSINLGVLNLLPFPALDGGHLIFVLVGDFLGERRKAKAERIINIIGFSFLISLMVLVTISDILRFFKDSFLVSLLKNIFKN